MTLILDAFQDAVINNGIVAPKLYLPLDFDFVPASGIASPSAQGGLVVGGGTPQLLGTVDDSTDFNGSTAYLELGALNLTGGTTLHSFVILADVDTDRSFNGLFGVNNANRINVFLGSLGELYFRYGNGTTLAQVAFTNVLKAAEGAKLIGLDWNESASTVTLFLDGVPVETQAIATVENLEGGSAWRVGTAVGNFFDGRLSHFAAFGWWLGASRHAAMQAAREEERLDDLLGEYVPKWPVADRVTFTPKAGLPGTLDGSFGAGPLGEYLDLSNLIRAGSLTTANPDLMEQLRETGLFDEA